MTSLTRRVPFAAAGLMLTAVVGWPQVCRNTVSGLNQNRRVMGPVHAECPPSLHTPPFGNWGVTSNFGQKSDGHQFQGWCHDVRVCDNDGNCSTQCRDGWWEWNSCTDAARWAPPNCFLYNDANCTQQRSVMGVNVHGTRRLDTAVRCPADTNGDGVSDTGGCLDNPIYRSGANFMSLYELDPGTTDDLVQTVYFPEIVLNLECDPLGCRPVQTAWAEPSFYDSPAWPPRVYAQFSARLDPVGFIDTSGGCRATGPNTISVSGASYLSPAAPESIVSVFGRGLGYGAVAAATTPLPTELGGVRATITDSAGVSHSAPLFFVSPEQVNLLVPAGVTTGKARVVITRSDTVSSTGPLQVAEAAPGLFSADSTGSGPAAAHAVRVTASGAQIPVPVYTCSAGACTAVPIDLGGASDSVYVSLYGTGIRRSAVTAWAAGQQLQVTYSGAQGQYAGVDQVNVLLPSELRGAGVVEVTLEHAGVRSNAVDLRVQ